MGKGTNSACTTLGSPHACIRAQGIMRVGIARRAMQLASASAKALWHREWLAAVALVAQATTRSDAMGREMPRGDPQACMRSVQAPMFGDAVAGANPFDSSPPAHRVHRQQYSRKLVFRCAAGPPGVLHS